jgi:hypothetical protein
MDWLLYFQWLRYSTILGLKNFGICAKYKADGWVGAIDRIFRATHTKHESPANVTPFDIIIKADGDALRIRLIRTSRDASFGEGNAIFKPRAFPKEIENEDRHGKEKGCSR